MSHHTGGEGVWPCNKKWQKGGRFAAQKSASVKYLNNNNKLCILDSTKKSIKWEALIIRLILC